MRAETRHQLKEDRFSKATFEVAEKTVNWSHEHQSILIGAAVAVVVIAALVVGGWYYISTQDEKASLDFAKAVRTLDAQLRPAGSPAQPGIPSFESANERATAARKQFQAIVDKYPHTHTADMAHYFLGVTAVNLSDNATAEKNFKDVADSGNKEVSSVAKLALASLYGQTNRPKDAIAIYQQLINKPTASVSKVTAQLQLAELYQNTNAPLDAKKIYEQVKKDNPTGEAGQLATQKLTELK